MNSAAISLWTQFFTSRSTLALPDPCFLRFPLIYPTRAFQMSRLGHGFTGYLYPLFDRI